jgi:hypothetical protein
MDKGNFRRERLAELGLEGLQRPPKRGLQAKSRNLSDRWHRFIAAGWERPFFAVACVVAVVIAIVGVVALATRGGGGNTHASSVTRLQATPTKQAGVLAAPTSIVIDVPVIPTRQPTDEPTADATNREDCEAIRGTPYRSAAERNWYADNCPDGGQPVKGSPTRPAGSTPGQPTAPPPPTAPQGVSSGQAIALAVTWMTTSAPKAYTVDSSTCSAIQFGDHWTVSCTGRLAGCQSAACAASLDVCVFADRRVVSAADC